MPRNALLRLVFNETPSTTNTSLSFLNELVLIQIHVPVFMSATICMIQISCLMRSRYRINVFTLHRLIQIIINILPRLRGIVCYVIVAKYSNVQLSTYDNILGVIIDMENKIDY